MDNVARFYQAAYVLFISLFTQNVKENTYSAYTRPKERRNEK
jgi:hypothetical protein